MWEDPSQLPLLNLAMNLARYNDLMGDVSYVDGVLLAGAKQANLTAEVTLANCKDAMGFVVPPRG